MKQISEVGGSAKGSGIGGVGGQIEEFIQEHFIDCLSSWRSVPN